jgi:hypothetical protein
MVRGQNGSVRGGRPGWIAVATLVSVATAHVVFAQQQPAQQGQAPAQQGQAAPAQQAQAAPTTRVFASDAGMVLNFIKPDKTGDFEMVVQKLKEALQKSEKPERKQQAASWKVFRSPDQAAGGNALYVFIIDPAVKGADYTVSNILAEAFPPEQLNTLYKQYAESYAQGQNIVNLTLVSDLAK